MCDKIRQTLLTLTVAAPLALLAGCGGGGSLTDTTTDGTATDGTTTDGTTPDGTSGDTTQVAGAPAAIEFVSANPTTLAMEGVAQAGLSQTSQLTFKVVDDRGTPVPDQNVSFALSNTAGGIRINPISAKTSADGLVAVTVTAGSVAGPVSVTATVEGTSYSVQSSQLVVTTGVADQDSFSLSVSNFAPEGADYDGIEVDVTARLADRYNNPVPDGTAVVFTTEGGSIVGSCTTANGACSVKWTSQNPRPADGRSTLVAYAVGEESYTEVNGDGRFGPEDSFDLVKQDIGEPFRDDNEDGQWQQGEWFFDFIKDGSRNEGDGLFNGWLCDDTTRCSTNHSVNVFGQAVIVMAESTSGLYDTNNQALPKDLLVIDSTSSTGSVSFKILGKQTAQIMPAGTKIKAETNYGTFSNGKTTMDVTVPNTNDRDDPANKFTLNGTGNAGSGVITVTVTTPKGQITTHNISVTETTAP